jgi:uncharacterized membrane-anchored protein YhcB (DUF1043 family)
VRRNWFIAAIVLGVVAIAVAALAMRLKADNTTSKPTATEWASSVCTSLATWKSSIESLANVSGETLNQDTLSQKIDDAQVATETLVSDLKALGPPDLESGDQLEQDLSSDVDQLQASFDSLKQGALEATQAGSPADFLKALGALGPQFQSLREAASKTVDDLQNANIAASAKSELQAAFASAQSCQDLKSNG